MIVGITGFIGAGKTTAACFFPKQNWRTINVDILGHQILEKPAIKKQLIKKFGKQIIENSKVSRKKLAASVFQDTKNLQQLNVIMHPFLKKEIEKRMYSKNTKNAKKHLLLDCALLHELGLADKCDWIIEIFAPDNLRYERLKNRYTKKQQETMKKKQKKKKNRTADHDFVVINDSTKQQLRMEIQKIITFLYRA